MCGRQALLYSVLRLGGVDIIGSPISKSDYNQIGLPRVATAIHCDHSLEWWSG